jgi:methionine--tRNA ligase beta chain
MISFDEFKKLDLRAGRILGAERIEESEKLLNLEVDIGDQKRRIIAGIGKMYRPEELPGRSIIIIANLEPKKIMGLESQGMLLAASGLEGPVILMPEREVPPGTEIR